MPNATLKPWCVNGTEGDSAGAWGCSQGGWSLAKPPPSSPPLFPPPSSVLGLRWCCAAASTGQGQALPYGFKVWIPREWIFHACSE